MKWRLVSLVGAVAVLAGCATEPAPQRSTATRTAAPVPLPIAAAPTSAPVWPLTAPETRARSAIMIDARTGRTLYQKNADNPVQVASTQKIVTALIISESGNLDHMVRIDQADTLVEPTKLGVRPGQTYSRLNLLSAMLVKSENDAAAALARDHAGSISGFAADMNRKARECGATNSYFLNPHGLPAPQYSTARDMARIAYRVYRDPLLRRLTSQRYYSFTFNDGRTRLLENTNKLLKFSAICNGMKTGYTNAAGRCLISTASYGGRDVILAQYGSRTEYIFNDADRLMNWGLQVASVSPTFSPSGSTRYY